MYAQLGAIIFEGLNGFDSFEHKDTTTYAQYDIINGKPTIAPTGNDLEEITIAINLRAEFIKPEEAILQLKRSKDNFEVLPLVKGSGRYIGDFVITEMSVTDKQALADGTTIEANVSLTLKEYASTDKLQQQQTAARKQAFATGDKKPLSVAAIQKNTLPQLAALDMTIAASHANIVDEKVSEYENNISQQQNIGNHIQSSLQVINDKMDSFNSKVNNISALKNAQDISDRVSTVKDQIKNFQFPITSLDDLKLNNRNLQQVMRNFSTTAITLTNLVITRAA